MTLYSFIKNIIGIGEAQPNVKFVRNGDVYELNKRADIDYPAIIISQNEHLNNNVYDNELYGITIFAVDRLTSDKSNQLDIQSWANQLLKNIANLIEEYDLGIITGDVVIQPFTERFESLCAGCYAKLQIQLDNNDCTGDLYFSRLVEIVKEAEIISKRLDKILGDNLDGDNINKINRLAQYKNDIKQAIINRNIDASDDMSEYASDIENIKDDPFVWREDLVTVSDYPMVTESLIKNINSKPGELYFQCNNADEYGFFSVTVYLTVQNRQYQVEIGHIENNNFISDVKLDDMASGTIINILFKDYNITNPNPIVKISSEYINYYHFLGNATINDKSFPKVNCPVSHIVIDVPATYSFYVQNGYYITYTTESFIAKNITNRVTTLNRIFYNGNMLKEVSFIDCDLTSVNSISNMFYNCSLISKIDLSKYTFANSVNLSGTFQNCRSLTDVKLNVRANNMNGCFYNCTNLTNIDVSNIDVLICSSFESCFRECRQLKELDLSNWTTSSALTSTGSHMFNNCYLLTKLKLSDKFDTSGFTSCSYMFSSCYNLVFDDILNIIKIGNRCTSLAYMFNNARNLKYIDMSAWDTSSVSNFSYMFYNCWLLENLKMSNKFAPQINLSYMFGNCYLLNDLDMSEVTNTDVININGVTNMFNGCNKINKIVLPNCTMNINVTTSSWFSNCNSLIEIINLNNIVINSGVAGFSNMFNGCYSLRHIDMEWFSIPSTATALTGMFQNCHSLEKIEFPTDLTRYNTSKINGYDSMFSGCRNIKEIIIPFANTNTASTNFRYFADDCINLEVLDTNFDLSKAATYNPTISNNFILKKFTFDKGPVVSFDYSKPRFEREQLLDMINKLNNITTTRTLTLAGNKAKLTDDEIKIITDKGWTIA